MCCSWTVGVDRGGGGGGTSSSSGTAAQSFCKNSLPPDDMSCVHVNNAILADLMKHKIRRDLSRWSRKLLLCLGKKNRIKT